MNEPGQTCPIADTDTDVRYLAGSLTDAEAEAFEEHYFGCDACSKAVQRGAEIRSALSQSPTVAEKTTPTVLRQSIKRRTWWPALAAAAVIVVSVGLWKFPITTQPVSEITEAGRSAEPTRGTAASPAISAIASDQTLTASWSRTPEARTYRVRLLAEDGRLLLDREISDTSIVIPLDAGWGVKAEGAIYWKVEGLNDLRVVVSNYALTPARPAH
jgi:hypothetical protein